MASSTPSGRRPRTGPLIPPLPPPGVATASPTIPSEPMIPLTPGSRRDTPFTIDGDPRGSGLRTLVILPRSCCEILLSSAETKAERAANVG